MVERQLRRRGIRDARVLAAMGEIPREEFVPAESRVMAYWDDPAPIGRGQTISQPYMTALMAQELELKKPGLVGDPVSIAEQVAMDDRGAAAFSLSADGKLAARHCPLIAREWQRHHVAPY